MRRWVSAMQVGALVAVLCSGVAAASITAPLDNSFAPQSFDFSAQLFARIFDEASVAQASFTASGDSSLRGLAFTMKSTTPPAPAQHVAAALPAPTITISDPSFAAPLPAKQVSLAQLSAQTRTPVIGYYESALPSPTDAPATHRFDLTALEMSSAQLNGFAAAALAAGASNVQTTGAYVPMHLGKLQFAPHAEAGESNALQSNTTNGTVGAGATLNVRAGARNVGLDLSSALEHVTLSAPQFSATSAAAPSLSGAQLPVFVPAYADVSAQTISTGLTVPVTRKLTASVQYDTQHLLGAYGVPGATNLDANNTIYGAQLTYNLKGWSAISLSTRQYHFQDNLLPSNALTQINTNVNFTIKF
jgi:hypothetical protein